MRTSVRGRRGQGTSGTRRSAPPARWPSCPTYSPSSGKAGRWSLTRSNRNTCDMLNSALRSRAEYAELGADGLAARTTPERDALIVKAVEELLDGKESVLDLCCGYG